MAHMPNKLLPARSRTICTSALDIASKLARAVSPVVDGCLPPLTGVDGRLPDSRNAKTNPTKPVAPRVNARHLAVARMIAEGKTNPQIATALGITRQAVWKRSRLPAVIAEVERAHLELLRSTARQLTKVDGR